MIKEQFELKDCYFIILKDERGIYYTVFSCEIPFHLLVKILKPYKLEMDYIRAIKSNEYIKNSSFMKIDDNDCHKLHDAIKYDNELIVMSSEIRIKTLYYYLEKHCRKKLIGDVSSIIIRKLMINVKDMKEFWKDDYEMYNRFTFDIGKGVEK